MIDQQLRRFRAPVRRARSGLSDGLRGPRFLSRMAARRRSSCGCTRPTATSRLRAKIAIADLPLEAASPGAWANTLRARIDGNVSADVASVSGYGGRPVQPHRARHGSAGAQETFLNVTDQGKPASGRPRAQGRLVHAAGGLRAEPAQATPCRRRPTRIPTKASGDAA